tara:strand:+ start:319 stop:510 length:192 start_codon:yes stop_codon:yes gene_type:complete
MVLVLVDKHQHILKVITKVFLDLVVKVDIVMVLVLMVLLMTVLDYMAVVDGVLVLVEEVEMVL